MGLFLPLPITDDLVFLIMEMCFPAFLFFMAENPLIRYYYVTEALKPL